MKVLDIMTIPEKVIQSAYTTEYLFGPIVKLKIKKKLSL
jgi:hypothetical protein